VKPSEAVDGHYYHVVLEGQADTRLGDSGQGFWLGEAGNRAWISDKNTTVMSVDEIQPPPLDPREGTLVLVTLKAGVDPNTVGLLKRPRYQGETQVLFEVVTTAQGRRRARDVIYKDEFTFNAVLNFFDVTKVWTPA